MKTTKQLARELGLLRERKLSSASGEGKKKHKSCQSFSYLIVIDFESTCWERDKSKTQEIIEFPAVLLNTKTGQIESEFHYYVQPQEHPTLSAFCRQLTGISQDQVDNGIPVYLCLRKFSHWLHKLSQEKNICLAGNQDANTGDKPINLAAIVTWSDWDLGVCLHYELKRKQIAKAPCFNQWIDLRATYTKFYGRKPKGLNGALQDVGIEFEGREHSGLHDSRNTATLAWRMIRDGCIMNITKSLVSASANSAGCIQAPEPKNGKPLKQKTPHKSPRRKTPQKSPKQKAPQKTPVTENTGIQRKGDSASFTLFKDPNTNNTDITVGTCGSGSHVPPTGLRMRDQNVPQSLNSGSRYSKQTEPLMKRPAVFTPEKGSDPKCPRFSAPVRRPSQYGPASPKNKSLMTTSSFQEVTAGKLRTPTGYDPAQSVTAVTKRTEGPTSLTCTSNFTPSACTGGNFKKPSPMNTPVAYVHGCPSSRANLQNSKIPVISTIPTSTEQCISKTAVSSSGSTIRTHTGNSYPTPNSRFQGSRIPVTQSLRTPSPPQNVLVNKPASASSTCFQTPSHLIHSHMSSYYNTASLRTPQHVSMTSASSMKATPPLCKCGRRAKRRMVQNPGPNTGRWFFSCIKGTANSVNSRTTGCGFFQWEQPSRTVTPRPVTPVSRFVHTGANAARPFTPVLQASGSQNGYKRLGISNSSANSLK